MEESRSRRLERMWTLAGTLPGAWHERELVGIAHELLLMLLVLMIQGGLMVLLLGDGHHLPLLLLRVLGLMLHLHEIRIASGYSHPAGHSRPARLAHLLLEEELLLLLLDDRLLLGQLGRRLLHHELLLLDQLLLLLSGYSHLGLLLLLLAVGVAGHSPRHNHRLLLLLGSRS